MTHDVFALEQAGFRGRNDDGNETGATWKQPLNNNWTQNVDEKFRVRFLMQESGAGTASGTIDGQLQYQLAGGGWNNVTTSSSVCRAVASGDAGGPYDGTATTQQLGSGTFVAGTISEDGLAAQVSLSGDDETELEYVLTIQSADVTNGQALELRVTDGSTTPSFTQVPSITIQELTNYTLTAASGSFAFSGPGTEVNLEYGRVLVAASGGFTLTGTDASLEYGREVAADSGGFTLSGTDVGLLHDKILTAESGSFGVTGTAVVLSKGFTLAAASGSYGVTGTDVGLLYNKVLAADTVAFTVNGTAVTLSKGFTLTAAAGSFSVAGTATTLLHDAVVQAISGSFNVSGTDALLEYGRVFGIDTTAFSLAGSDATLKVDRVLAAESGSFSMAGTAAGVGRQFTLPAASGSFDLTGSAAGVLVDYVLSAESGSVALTGTAVTFLLEGGSTYTLEADAGTFNVIVKKYTLVNGEESSVLDTDLASASAQTVRTSTAVPLAVSVDRDGGLAGLTVTAQVRDGGTTNSYLDFNDMTFKTSGWTTKSVTLSDLGGGFYASTLDLSAVTNLPSADLIVEYTATGGADAVGVDIISFQTSNIWTVPQALTVPKFLGLK